MIRHSVVAPLALAAWLAAGGAQAQSAGTWMVKAGVNNIAPQVKSGDLSAPSLPGTRIDVTEKTSVILTATYMLTDAWSVEAFAGLPYKHDIVGDGAIAGAGKIGSLKQVSPTVFVQYRFMAPTAQFRPYVGVGPTRGHFYGEEGTGVLTALTAPGGKPTRLDVKDAWGTSVQVGGSFALAGRWYADLMLVKTFIKTDATLSTGQTISTKLDPVSMGIAVGYRF